MDTIKSGAISVPGEVSWEGAELRKAGRRARAWAAVKLDCNMSNRYAAGAYID